MGGLSAKRKGANGEREAAKLLVEWIAPVYQSLDLDPPTLERNLMQSRMGGFDLVGLEWLALEVKRQENVSLPAWWRQTLRQANTEQVPFLLWRQNRTPWKARVRISCAHGRGERWALDVLDVDLDADRARDWLQRETYWRLVHGG